MSFKSFLPENALSMANDYYTFKSGKLWKHHDETVDRNTFYEEDLVSSSVEVVLNDNPSSIKDFHTLNYEGSQSKIDLFTSETKHETDPFQPTTVYNDQEIYNLTAKHGWYVEKIFTDKEEGYVNEFIEKEGKWFNNINRLIDVDLEKADTADFTFQGIGGADVVALYDQIVTPPLPGAIETTETTEETETTTETTEETETTGETETTTTTTTTTTTETTTTPTHGTEVDIKGCMDPNAINYNPLATGDDGSCVYDRNDDVKGCMDPNALNYNPLATGDDGSCIYRKPRPKIPRY